jgi:hypothetical protein
VIAIGAIIRFVMPPLADATGSLTSSNDTLNADVDHVIAISAVTMPDDTSVEVWAKNVGSTEIAQIALMSVEFGRESNAVPVPYGGTGCSAPCWWYDLEAPAWTPGETLALHVDLGVAAEDGGLYRIVVRGARGGQASETVRAP